jgi:hypothetical protein
MKKLMYAVLVCTLWLAAVCPSYGQWPLGKEALQDSKSGDPGPNVTVTGRFQIFVSPQAKGYTFMLDTDTGKVWIMKKDHASGEFSFQRIPVDQVDGKDSVKPGSQEKKPVEPDQSGKK